MRENQCILELYVQTKCQASMKIEQKPFKICNDSFFFSPRIFSEKVNEVVSQQNVGNKSNKRKKQVSGNNNSGGKEKSDTYNGWWM